MTNYIAGKCLMNPRSELLQEFVQQTNKQTKYLSSNSSQ